MAEKNFGLVQVFYGNGKGKTTAALGETVRALGRGFKVHLIQFMKCGIAGNKDFEEYGELMVLRKLKGFSLERFGLKEWVVGKPSKAHIEECQRGIEAAKKALSSKKFDLVVLDECLYAVQLGLLTESEVLELIKSKRPETELILTGSHRPLEKIIEESDLVSEVKKVKHPFDRGIGARIGIEY
ncbi:MAG: cob(I)yrinic acid a,c-diamide adenosyltransferase [Candidatus Diapherotrites archaeon]|uniref:Cob(I)yrinic acid a,c-diamide adenosyltransferase n=1 Tax=Candidatus Iainarchaeum sp. TaxID=3101447 RepID=A0A7J4IRV1_9ARCH|nr:MAG: cob(I)alamin adenosyltransferase [archaeon GW2011_AR10]MBS3058825.1 cob(I)yrinic acid a,c-diamide adenosyltransferase [Candidatus Diapherotrites archaeon]HIH08243.1 cob(I)yrinic acid a,c-diamide adenosyltransferase [Candidatus Diapherotrites archaeon]